MIRYATIVHNVKADDHEGKISVALWLVPLIPAMLPLFDVLGRFVSCWACISWTLGFAYDSLCTCAATDHQPPGMARGVAR